MKRQAALFFLIIFTSVVTTSYSQDGLNKRTLVGSWLGRVEVSSVALRVIFNISLNDRDSLLVTLDSPDQGAKDIKVGPLTLTGDQISIKAPVLMAEYTGTIKNDTLMEGILKQAGRELPLNLAKMGKPLTINRPQEPKPPFPYKSEDIKFRNEKAGITLGGTVTIPEGDGPFPAVILITGSGAQNRNEELMAHKPFWVIADYLSRNGIAVLRFDDRGVGQSQNSSSPSTSVDFATDADAAFKYLKTIGKIDTTAIGLAGHSEGGLVASIAASGNPSIAFVVSLAGPGVSGEQILYRQNYDLNKASGMSKNDLRAMIKMSRKMYAVIKREPDNARAREQMTEILKESMEKQKASAEETEKALKGFPASAATLTSPWYRTFLVTDPAAYWKNVRCPVLALNGDKDLQVASDVNLPAIRKAVMSGGNSKVTVIVLPGLNHIFQNCKTGLPAEYGQIEETFSPVALKTIADWINGL